MSVSERTVYYFQTIGSIPIEKFYTPYQLFLTNFNQVFLKNKKAYPHIVLTSFHAI